MQTRIRMALAAVVAGILSFISPSAHAVPTCTASDYATSTHMGSGTYSQYSSGEQSGVMYTVLTFTNTSTNCLLILPSSVTKADVLVVGGGAGGGPRGGGGGGAGGYFFGSGYSITAPETITVGAGGSSTTSSCPGNGGDSTFGPTQVDGGGGGGGSGCNGGASVSSGQPFGSGGGALYSTNVGIQLSSTYVSANILGNVGGAGTGSQVPMGWAAGGGGGAKNFGESATVTNSNGTGYAGVLSGATNSGLYNFNGIGGKGGAGFFNLITGSKICYSAGGGGGNSLGSSGSAGSGGSCSDGIDTVTAGGGGGHGGASDTAGSSIIFAGSGATPGSGGGGGGFGYCTSLVSANCTTNTATTPVSYNDGVNGSSGAGASGIVVVRYITPINYGVNPALTTLHNSSITISDTGTVSGFTRSWQWYRSTNSGSSYSAISGATNASYTFTPDLPSYNNNLFRLSITDTSPTGEVSTATSSPLTLTVTANSASFSNFALAGSAISTVYRTSIAVTATVNTAGKVTFYSMGKPVPNCKNISTTGSGPITAVCNWKPALHGVNSITAKLVPTDVNYSAQTSAPFRVMTVARGGTH
jgi:hypothetical protein